MTHAFKISNNAQREHNWPQPDEAELRKLKHQNVGEMPTFMELLEQAMDRKQPCKRRDWARHRIIECLDQSGDEEEWDDFASLLIGRPDLLTWGVVRRFSEVCSFDDIAARVHWAHAWEVSHLGANTDEEHRRQFACRCALVTLAAEDLGCWHDLRAHFQALGDGLPRALRNCFNDRRLPEIPYLPAPVCEEKLPEFVRKDMKQRFTKKAEKAERDRELRQKMRGGRGSGGGDPRTDPNSPAAKKRARKHLNRRKKK